MSDAPAMTRHERRAQVLRISLLAVAAFLAVLAWLWDWDWFKGPVERRVSAATGRPFTIGGHLEVELGRIVVVRAGDLSLANTPWSLTPEMARADLLRLEIPLGPFLRGQRTLRRIDIVRPALLLERNGRGKANWQFANQRDTRQKNTWTLGELRVHEGRLDVRDVPLNTNLRLTVDSASQEPGAESVRLLVRGSGRYRGHPFQLDGWADSPVALLDQADAAYRVDMSARAGTTRARAYGALTVPLDLNHFTVLTELRGNDLEDLYPLLGLAVPSTPPYSVSGELEREGRVVNLRRMRGRVGDSDVSGEFSIDLTGRKPLLRADLEASRLDLDDLGGLVGLPPSIGRGESASPEQRAEARKRAASPRLLPDRDYDLRKLNSMDAEVHLHAARIDAGKWPIDTLAMRLKLHDGLLQLDPVDVGFAGGEVKGEVRLDARKRPIDAAADLALRSVDLEQMWPDMQPPNVGRLNGKVQLQGHGNSIAEMLATADGQVQMGMGRGRFSNLLLELAGLDVAETLKFLVGKDRTVKLRCAYGDFGVEDGLVQTRSLVFDTTDTVIFGTGSVDLGAESLALEIRPEPKDFSPVSLRGPLLIGGTLKDPSFVPKPKQFLARVAAAAALYAIAPPAALLALIETGPGENVDCHTGKKQGGKDEFQDAKSEPVEADQKRNAAGDEKPRDHRPKYKEAG